MVKQGVRALGVAAVGLLVFGIAGPPAAAAQDLQGTRSLAMGGSLRAAPTGETALLLNPAGMTLARSYVINALYQYRGSDTGSLVNASVVDSATKKLAAGLYYSFMHATPSRTIALGKGKIYKLEETLQTHEAGLALAYPIGDMFHLGVTNKYVNQGIEQPEDIATEAKQLQRDGNSGYTLDAGLIVKLMPSLNIAVVGQNLVPLDIREYPRLLGMGISYALGTTLLAEFDAVLDFDSADEIKPSYHGGAELFFAKRYAIRGGAQHDTVRDATYVTGGVGIVVSKLALDVGLRQMVDGGSETLFAVSARLFLQ